MELTIESALSPGGLVGHSSYLLLVISMLMRSMWLLRSFVVASALVAITYDAVWLNDPVGVFWESLLVTVNLVQLALLYLGNRRARFSAEEQEFMEGRFQDLGAGLRRRLLAAAHGHDTPVATYPPGQGSPVQQLVFVADGEVVVQADGATVAICRHGSFIGEMTVLGAEPATGTAIVGRALRAWSIDGERLRALADQHPDIRRSLEVGFSHNVREKLIEANRYIAGVRRGDKDSNPA